MSVSLKTYRETHGAFDPIKAQEWIKKECATWYCSPVLEHIFFEALLEGEQQWIDLLSPNFKHKSFKSKDFVLRVLFEQNHLKTLERCLPWVEPSSVNDVMLCAVSALNADVVELLLPYSKPQSHNSRYLQHAVMGMRDAEKSRQVLDVLIPASDPNKAARNLLSRQIHVEADLIMSHTKTPINLLESVLHYAKNQNCAMPLTTARFEQHQLNMSVTESSRVSLRKKM